MIELAIGRIKSIGDIPDGEFLLCLLDDASKDLLGLGSQSGGLHEADAICVHRWRHGRTHGSR